MTKPTIRPVLPAKTQISLYIHPVAMALVYPSLDRPEAVRGTCDKRRHRSDCADAQSDLCLRLPHKSYCRFCRALAQFQF